MPGSSNNSGVLIRTALAAFFAVVGAGQARVGAQAADPTVTINAFLHAAYPDLSGPDVTMTIRGEGVYERGGPILDFWVGLERPSPAPPVVRRGPPPRQAMLSAWVLLRDGSVYQFLAATGPLVNEEKLTAARKQVDEHPEWTDEQAIAALKQAGARYGPDEKEAFLKIAHPTALAPFLKRFKVLSVQFQPHLPNVFANESTREEAGLEWVIQLWSEHATPLGDYCVVRYEPFDGRLTSFVIMKAPGKPPWK